MSSVDGGVQDEVALAFMSSAGFRRRNGLRSFFATSMGLSHEQAAQQLRWPVGTVRSRLREVESGFGAALWPRAADSSAGGSWRGHYPPRQPRSGDSGVTGKCHRRGSGRFSRPIGTPWVLSESVTFLVEGAIKAMFVSRVKLAILARPYRDLGAFVAVQQVRSAPQCRPARCKPK